MKNRVLWYVLLFIVPARIVFGLEYNLEAILKLAEKNNKDIKLAQSNLYYAATLKKEALSQALPHLSAGMNYNRNFLANKFFFTITDSLGQERTQSFTASFDNVYQFSTSLNQSLFTFGKIGNALRAANYFNHYSQYQFNGEHQAIITRIKKAFYLTLLQQKVWEVAIQSQESAYDNYENIKLRFESGTVSEFDLLQAETRWQNTIPATTLARKNYEVALNNLKSLVDIPLREEIVLVGGLETFPPLPDSLDYLVVFDRRPDYNALLWEKRLQEKRISIERSNYFPSLYGNLTYVFNSSSNEFKLENKNDNIILGLSLNIPIFSGLYTPAQVQKARIDLERVKTRISKAHDDIRVELKNIYLRMQESRQRIEAASKSITTAQRAFEIAETRVQNGLATQLEFRESRVDLDRAQLNYYIAIYDYLEAYFDWQQATGSVNFSGL